MWVVVVAVAVSVWAAAPVGAQSNGYEDVDAASSHGWAVYALAGDGVFEGTECEPGLFCPADGVQRWVMAVWLVRVLDGSDPEAGASRFSDVEAGVWWEPHVERLAQLGVTRGCGEDLFCPYREVTRAEMASFLVRAFGLAPGADAGFDDVASGSAHEANINALAASRVTLGCGEGLFCPGRVTTRAEMATFLTRALSTESERAAVPVWRFRSVGAGYQHACGLRTENTVACWGDNYFGQSDAPLGRFEGLSVGAYHSCGVRAGGTLACWGSNSKGQADVPAGRFRTAAAGVFHSCGLRTDRSILCWGSNSAGQADAPAGQFLAVAAGGRNSCGLRTDRTIACWGADFLEVERSPEQPILVEEVHPPAGQFQALTMALLEDDGHLERSCGLRTDLTIACWGGRARLSDSDGSGPHIRSSAIAQSDRFQGQFKAVATSAADLCGVRADGSVVCAGWYQPAGEFKTLAGSSYSGLMCGLRADGTVACWGDGGVAVQQLRKFQEISVGESSACGRRDDGVVHCWHGVESREYLVGTDIAPWVEQSVSHTQGAQHWCGLSRSGSVLCWGSNVFAQTEAPGGQFQHIAAGYRHTCVLGEDGAAVCWGDNGAGQTEAPAGRFKAVAGGGSHTCGLRDDASIVCWGRNRHGQTDVPDGRFQAVTAGNEHSCGLRADNTVVCWGDNYYGQTDAPEGEFQAVSAGRFFTCGLRPNNAIVCWGRNDEGQTDAPRGRFTAVAAGWNHSCGLRVDLGVTCWGAKSFKTA